MVNLCCVCVHVFVCVRALCISVYILLCVGSPITQYYSNVKNSLEEVFDVQYTCILIQNIVQ